METTLARTALHDEHQQLGAKMAAFAGWDMPIRYGSIVQEHNAVRQAVGLFDVSHMGQLFLSGPGALELADRVSTNDMSTLGVGRAKYTVCCNVAGGVLDDLIVYRLATDRVMIVCNASNRFKIVAHLRAHLPADVAFDDLTASRSLVAIQGPNSVALLAALGAGEVARALPRFGVTTANVAGLEAIVARTGYTGEDGFEVSTDARASVALWRAALAHGPSLGACAIGLGARDTLRLESAYPLYGHELSEEINPLEAGLGWVVKLDAADFIGKSALVAARDNGLTRSLVGLEVVDRGIAREGYPVHVNGNEVGFVTSGGPAPALHKNVALAYVPPRHASLGTSCDVVIRGKPVGAVVVSTPFYRRSL